MVSTNSPWQEIVSIALLGTERQPFQPPIAPGKLGDILAQLRDKTPEAALLSTAAIVSLHQQVGWSPERRSLPPLAVCPSEDLPQCNLRATRLLQQMLQGQHSQLIAEWLQLAAIAGQRLPNMSLPALLDKGRQQRELRALILPVLGQRGRWLAAQNPDWSYAVALTIEADWETGASAARLLALQDLRLQNPDRARELLQSTWSQETASDRTKFLETFRTELSSADVPFLEQALGDRSKEVRRVAIDLLASLPSSRLCQEIIEYTCRYITLDYNKPPALQVQLPEQFDEAWTQFGIESKLPPALNSYFGEKAYWLLQMIGATPLTTWTEQWQLSLQEIVDLTESHEWQMMLLDGFALAAKRQRQDEWLEAIFKQWFGGGVNKKQAAQTHLNIEDLFSTLSRDRRHALLVNFLQGTFNINDPLVVWLLRYSSPSWSDDLGHLVLEGLENHLNEVKTFSNSDWELRAALKEFAQFIPVTLTPEVINLRSRLNVEYFWMQSIDEFLSILQFRQEIASAFG